MFRFAFFALAAFAVAALLFGGAGTAAAGLGFFALIPLLVLAKLAFVGMFFGTFARRGYGPRWRDNEFRTPWGRDGFGSRPPGRDEGRSETDRFEEWHRLAHAREEVDSWAPEPE